MDFLAASGIIDAVIDQKGNFRSKEIFQASVGQNSPLVSGNLCLDLKTCVQQTMETSILNQIHDAILNFAIDYET